MKTWVGSAVLLSAAAALTVGVVAPASGATTKVLPAVCRSAGTIYVRSVPTKISLRSCPLQGRLIVLRLPGGGVGPGLHIPGPGQGTGGSMLTRNGEYDLSVYNSKGTLRIRGSSPAKVTRTMVPATDAACSEGAFTTEGPIWANTGKANDSWWYNESTASRAGLTVAATEADIRAANTNLTTGANNCGFATNAFNVKGTFQGSTSLFANINPASQCTGNFPDGQNTVSWGTFDSNHTSTLAYTCYHWHTDVSGLMAMDEADTYLGSNRSIVDSFPASCSVSEDLQSVMTHEWGHAYGLNHVGDADSAEVMYPTKFACQLRRHLGLGDYDGMDALYP